MADLKGCCVDLFYCCRELQNPGSNIDERMKKLLSNLLHSICLYGMHNGSSIDEIYSQFEQLSLLIEELRKESDWVRSVISRAYQYRRFIIVDFEKIRMTHDYRTASTLRAYGLVFTSACPILFSPYFAKLSRDYGLWCGLYTCLVMVIMLITLYQVYEENEDPCDGIGRDDLDLDILRQVTDFMNPRNGSTPTTPTTETTTKTTETQ